jgi:hypothetical protein
MRARRGSLSSQRSNPNLMNQNLFELVDIPNTTAIASHKPIFVAQNEESIVVEDNQSSLEQTNPSRKRASLKRPTHVQSLTLTSKRLSRKHASGLVKNSNEYYENTLR